MGTLTIRGEQPAKAASGSKYANKKVAIGDLTFDSKKEARRWGELTLLERAGAITGLRRQTAYPLIVNEVTVAKYVSDFDYLEAGRLVVEDVKSPFTRKLPVYRLKAKMFAAQYGFSIREV